MKKKLCWCVLLSIIIMSQSCKTYVVPTSEVVNQVRFSVSAQQLLAASRMVDTNVASYLVSDDVVEKADLVKQNKKIIEDINKKLSKSMNMSKEQSAALSVFKKAEKYFNEICLSDNKE